MTRKVQTQLLVSPAMKARADALAVVMTVPRAEVFRVALEGHGLRKLEMEQAEGLRELTELAGRFRMTRDLLVQKMHEDRLTLPLIRLHATYPRGGSKMVATA